MRQENKWAYAGKAGSILYVLTVVIFAVAWTSWGLVFGLVALSLFALGAVIWILRDKLHSGGRLCSACRYYQAANKTKGTCTLTGNMAWPKATPCSDFILKDPPETDVLFRVR